MTTPPPPAGARAASVALRDYFAVELARLGLITTPGQVIAGTPRPTEVDAFPVVFVNRRTTDLAVRGDTTVRASYSLRVYGFARGQSYDEVEQAVDTLALRLRELLLTSPSAGGRITGAGVRPTMREDYSDVDTDATGRSLAGVYLDVTVDVDEQLPRTPGTPSADLGRVVDRVLTAVPAHPALD